MVELIRNNVEFANFIVGIATFCSSIFLGSLTVYFAKKNDEIISEMKKDREDEWMPIIKIDHIYLFIQRKDSFIQVYFENIGKGIAQQLHFEIPSLNYIRTHGIHGASVSLGPQEEEVVSQLKLDAESFKQLEEQDQFITISYLDIHANKFTTEAYFTPYDNDPQSNEFVVKHWEFKRTE